MKTKKSKYPGSKIRRLKIRRLKNNPEPIPQLDEIIKNLKTSESFKNSSLLTCKDLVKNKELTEFVILNAINLQFSEIRVDEFFQERKGFLNLPFWNLMFIEVPIEIPSGYRSSKSSVGYLLIGGFHVVSVMKSYILEADYDEHEFYNYHLDDSRIESTFLIRRKFIEFLINMLFKHRLGMQFENAIKNYSEDLTTKFNRKIYGIQKLS